MKKVFGALFLGIGVFAYQIGRFVDVIGDFFYETGEKMRKDTV